MIRTNIVTLKQVLKNKKPNDNSNIVVSKHNYKDPQNLKVLYRGDINDIPEDVLNLRLVAWLRKDGIYICE